MKKYYIHNGKEQNGPYSFEELKELNLAANTFIWFEGINGWTEIQNIPELRDVIKKENTPPPFTNKKPPAFIPTIEKNIPKDLSTSNSTFKLSILIEIISLIVSIIGFIYAFLFSINGYHGGDIGVRLFAIIIFVFVNISLVIKFNEKGIRISNYIVVILIINLLYLFVTQVLTVLLQNFDTRVGLIILETGFYLTIYILSTRLINSNKKG